MRRTRISVLSLVLATLAGAYGCESPKDPFISTTESLPPAPVAQRASSGRMDTYAFAWRSRSVGKSPGLLAQDLDVGGGLRLAGTLQAKGYGLGEDGFVVGLTIATLDEAELDVLGHNVLQDTSKLLGIEAVAVVDDMGALQTLEVPSTADPLTRSLLASIVARVDLRVPQDGAERDAHSIPVTQGLASASYRRRGNIVERQVEALQRLDAQPEGGVPRVRGVARIEYGADGQLVRIDAEDALLVVRDHEPLVEANSTFTLRRVDSRALEPGAAASRETRVAVDPLAPPDDEQAMRLLAERFADGISDFDIAIGLRAAGNGLPPQRGFMVRAVGRLRAVPHSARRIRDAFDADPRMDARTLAFDLLASAGTPEAQAVMRELLARPDVQQGAGFPRWVQNWSFVEQPQPASALSVLELAASDDPTRHPDAGPALLYPMGTMARRLSQDDPILATALADRVAAALGESEDRTATTAALAGLGNAGRSSDYALIAPYTLDADPQIRATAAGALRWSSAPEAPSRMLAMLSDRDPYVASEALDAALQTQTREAAAGVAAAALGGRINLEIATSVAVHLARRPMDAELLRHAVEGLAGAAGADQEADLRRVLAELDQEPSVES